MEMSKWLTDLARYSQPLILSAVGFFGTKLWMRMSGTELPLWALFVIVIGLGIIGIFIQKIAQWLWDLYQDKKIKHLVLGALLLGIVIWAGWPWQRIQNTFAEIRTKPPIISNRWMSEQEAEYFIIGQLQSTGAKEVFIWRVRYLLFWRIYERILGRYKCAEDSVWQKLDHEAFIAFNNYKAYDGNLRLSEFIGCDVEYATEFIYKIDWVDYDKRSSIKPPNPESSDSQ